MKTQPAIKSYFFDKGYKDLWNTIISSWKYNLVSAESYFDKTDTDNWVNKVLFFTAGLSVVVFGTLFFCLISILHIFILFTFLIIIYLSFTIIWAIDAGYRLNKSIFMACPYCYKKSNLPIYHCPKCNSEHDQLWPSYYGILKRTCNCGYKLPTTFLNGRSKLRASCPGCKNTIEAQEARPLVVPIIGAPSVGKTFFVFSMVYYIKELFSVKLGFKFEFMNTNNENVYNSEISILNSGQVLRKTTENNPIALNFFLSRNGTKSLLYFYDSAGEAFSNTQYLSQHKFYDYFHGLIFIIDPFSIPDVLYQYKNQLSLNPSIRPSNYPLEDVYEASIINLEKNYHFKITERINKPIAIIISKVDTFDLQNKIGNEAVNDLMIIDSTVKTKQEAMNKLCKDFLTSNGMGALLRKMEWKFPNSCFFSISSQGKNSIGIDDTTNWILGKIDKSFNNNRRSFFDQYLILKIALLILCIIGLSYYFLTTTSDVNIPKTTIILNENQKDTPVAISKQSENISLPRENQKDTLVAIPKQNNESILHEEKVKKIIIVPNRFPVAVSSNHQSSSTEPLKSQNEEMNEINLPNNIKYKGFTLNGEPSGWGTEYFPDKTYLVGPYKNGKRNGRFVYHQLDGSITMEVFKDGIRQK